MPKLQSKSIILLVAMIAALVAGAVACSEPEPDPQEVVNAYIETNINGLLGEIALRLTEANEALNAIPQPEIIEQLGANLSWSAAGTSVQGGDVTVTNVANLSLSVKTDTTPSVTVTVGGTMPFVFYVDGATVSRFEAQVDRIDLNVVTDIGFGR